jgi:rhodanese-related sulfurtransferase
MLRRAGIKSLARLLLVGSLALAALLAIDARARAETAVRRSAEEIARRWPRIDHLPGDRLAGLMEGNGIVLFDVREVDEYHVSRIPSAIRIDPDIRSRTFLDRYAVAVAGKTVVFYCAIGERSSRLAHRLAEDLRMHGALAVHNLAGGIFGWHDAARPLVNDAGPTEFVHPYNRAWGRVLSRQNLLRTKPQN